MTPLVMGRAAGKTRLIVELACAQAPSIIVVFSEQERKRVMGLVRDRLGAKAAKVNIVNAQQADALRGTRAPVFVDNADIILEMMLGRDVHTATLSEGP